MTTEEIKELPGKNLTEFSAFELEVLLDAIRTSAVYQKERNLGDTAVMEILSLWRTKVLEAKILVLQMENGLNG